MFKMFQDAWREEIKETEFIKEIQIFDPETAFIGRETTKDFQ